MAINTSVYGAADTWIESLYLSTGAMKAKCANFSGGDTLAGSTLAAGYTANKTPHDQLIDRSVSLTALGTESLYSHICYVNGADIYADNEIVTEFFFAESKYPADGSNVEAGKNYIYTDMPYNQWKTYSSSTSTYTNYSNSTIPIVEMNPKKVLYLLEVLACKADGTPNISGGVAVWTFIDDYKNNTGNVRTTYPHIMAARLSPRIDNSNTTTPNRTQLSDIDAVYGICINREFTAIPNTNIKINYAIFRSMISNCILIYGTVGQQPYDNDFYNLILADESDIVKNTISGLVWAQHEYNDDFYEFLIQQAACFGVYFRVKATGGSVESIPLNSDAVYLGLLDDQGIGHGEYTQGAENENNPIWNWISYSESPYDYTKPVDPTPYNNKTVFGSNGLYNTFVQYWALSPAALTGLCDAIYTYIDGLDPDNVDINQSIAKTFYTNNPLDVIVSLKRLPFDITQYSNITGTAAFVKLGNLSISSITGYKLNGQYTVVDFGSYPVYPKFGNTFLDYSPYTYFELIVPFCGSTRLDPALFMGKTLRLKMVVDLYTGACTCYILADNLCIDSISGNCAIDIPVSGVQSADYQNSVQNAITNVKNARITAKAQQLRGELAMGNIGKSIFGSSAAGIGNVLSNMGTSLTSALSLHSNIVSTQQNELQNQLSVNQAEYDLQHVQTPFNSVGSQSAANSYVEEMQARLIIYRPKFADGFDAAAYAKTIGYACLINGKVSDFTGLTVGDINTDNIVKDGISPTDTEKEMLKSLFAGGVYL